MRVSGGGHFKQKSIKSKFVSISLRDKLIFLFVGTLFVELLLFGCVMSFYLYINAKKNVSDNIDTTVTAVSEVMDGLFFTFNLFLTTAPNLCDCLLCLFKHNISQKFFHCLSLFRKMLFYNNLCFSSVANATLIICLFLPCFYNISNNTYPPFCKNLF